MTAMASRISRSSVSQATHPKVVCVTSWLNENGTVHGVCGSALVFLVSEDAFTGRRVANGVKIYFSARRFTS
jgi:hypothetical protein